MPFLQLMIAHLLGDFVFQTGEQVKRKYKKWTGSLEHIFIIGLLTTAVLFPYWEHTWTWITVFAIAATHFLQDTIKVWFDKRYNKDKNAGPFFLDQIIHVIIIALFAMQFEGLSSTAFPDWIDKIYFSQPVLIIILTVILLSYTFDISIFQFERHKNKKMKYHPDYVGMLERILAFAVTYFILLHVL